MYWSCSPDCGLLASTRCLTSFLYHFVVCNKVQITETCYSCLHVRDNSLEKESDVSAHRLLFLADVTALTN